MTDAAAPPRLSRREAALVVAASVVVCVALAAALGLRENAFGNMGYLHVVHAESVLDGKGFGRDRLGAFVPDLFLRPVYTLLLAPWVAVLGLDWASLRIGVSAMQGALNGLAALLVAGFVARAAGRTPARLAAWGVVLHPVLVSQAASLVDTAAFTCALVGAYAAAAAVPRDAPRTRWLLAGLALGVAVLTRSTAVAVVPAVALLAWRRTGSVPRAAAALALVLAGAGAVLAPWLLRNHALTDRWMLSTVDGVNLWMGNNDHTARFLDEGRSLDELPGRERYDSATKLTVAAQVESRDAAGAAAREFMRSHPGEAAVLALRKAGDLWSPLPTPRTTRSRLHGAKEIVALAWTLPLYGFALAGFVLAWRAKGEARALAADVLATAVFFTVPHALAWGGTRLRAPLDPFLVALAAIGLAAAWARMRRAH